LALLGAMKKAKMGLSIEDASLTGSGMAWR
jgi:hypothetical protein